MSFKKSLPYFFYQSLRFSSNVSRFRQHWSYYGRWWSSFSSSRNSVVDQQPWISFRAVDFLKEHLEREHTLFEYGGGGSTLFFLNRVAKVVTVEHDEEWFRILSRKIGEMGITHWEGIFQAGEPVEVDRLLDPANPADYVSSSVGQSALSYEKYAKAISRDLSELFDWVLVDGRARPSCMVASYPHLRVGGYLILDNMEREHYQRAFAQHLRAKFDPVLVGRLPSPYHPDFTETQIWRKK
jgi:hypothetical protein